LGSIALEGLDFFAYHGFHQEEQTIGNRYSLDITIETDLTKASESDDLNDTVDYSVLYQIAAAVMQERSKLLEHIGLKVIDRIRERYPRVDKVIVSVTKFNPPIGGVCARARITLDG
jgi:dihydroneopterin aldolase